MAAVGAGQAPGGVTQSPNAAGGSADPSFNFTVGETARASEAAAAAGIRSSLPVLSNGDRGPNVETLQKSLAALGYNPGVADGIFGNRTEAAVRAFQRDQGKSVDGVVGRGETWPAIHQNLIERRDGLARDAGALAGAGVPVDHLLDQIKDLDRLISNLEGSRSTGGAPGNPVRGLTEADFQAVADRLGVEVAAIKAVAEVESSGDGFLASGKPKILFERHIFSRLTDRQFDGVNSGISNRSPGGYGAAGEHQHDRLEEAIALDSNAALQSASWGRFQIMGFNYERAGYDSVESYVDAMRASEANQLDAFANFIASDSNMLQDLRNLNWAGFARRYNGPNFAQNNYDTRMAEAYARHSR